MSSQLICTWSNGSSKAKSVFSGMELQSTQEVGGGTLCHLGDCEVIMSDLLWCMNSMTHAKYKVFTLPSWGHCYLTW